MIVFKFDLRNMRLEKHDVYLEKTDRGAYVCIEDDNRTYLPKKKINGYEPFSLKGVWVLVFEGEYNINLAINGFLNAIISRKESQKRVEIIEHNKRLEDMDRKIEYFKSNLK